MMNESIDRSSAGRLAKPRECCPSKCQKQQALLRASRFS